MSFVRKKAAAVPEPEPTMEPDAMPGQTPDPGMIKLGANLDLTKASELAKALLTVRGSDVTVDASEVQHLGAQCGQILVSAKSTWQADGQVLNIVEASAEFHEGARLLGLQSALQDEDARL